MQIINKLTDLRYLEWTRIRHSSGTGGSFLKSMEKSRGHKYYYKLSNFDPASGITGHESFNEIIADRLLAAMGIEHLDYTLIHGLVRIKGRDFETHILKSEDFKKKGESKIALDAFYDAEGLEGESPMDFCIRYGFADYIYNMLIVDFLILNRDRHGANIEILKNTGNRSLRPAPLFDHGLSMLFNCHSVEEFKAFNPNEEKKVQCFVGGSNTYDNLKLIPADRLIKLPEFNEELKGMLLEGIAEIMGETFTESVWKFLKIRAEKYEDFCNKKR